MAARANRQRAYTGIDYALNRNTVSIGLGEVLRVDLTYELRTRLWNGRYLRIPAEDPVAVKQSVRRATVDVTAGVAHVCSPVAEQTASHPSPALQCGPTKQNASEMAPIKISVAAQVVSRLNQLRDRNLSPR